MTIIAKSKKSREEELESKDTQIFFSLLFFGGKGMNNISLSPSLSIIGML
jgi:hypothetical protein